jgi:hypothetical protein
MSTPSTEQWARAQSADTGAVDEFLQMLTALPDSQWAGAIQPGKWSGAELGVHIALAYEMGAQIGTPAGRMVLRVSPIAARIARWVLFPRVARGNWFPSGAKSPREVRPVLAPGPVPTRTQIDARIRTAMATAHAALVATDAAPPSSRFVHAYFGEMSSMQQQQLLTSHTRHHTRVLRAQVTR